MKTNRGRYRLLAKECARSLEKSAGSGIQDEIADLHMSKKGGLHMSKKGGLHMSKKGGLHMSRAEME